MTSHRDADHEHSQEALPSGETSLSHLRLFQDTAPPQHLPPLALHIGGVDISLGAHLGLPPSPGIAARLAPFIGHRADPTLKVYPKRVTALANPRHDSHFTVESGTPLKITGSLFSLRYNKPPPHATLHVEYLGSYDALLGALRLGLAHHLVHRGRGLLLHSSLALFAGRGILFPGPSGTGKTTAVSSCPGTLLSDEITALVRKTHDVVAWGTPFGNRLPPSAIPAPQVVLLRLLKDQHDRLEELSPSKALTTLLRATVLVPGDTLGVQKLLPLVLELLPSLTLRTLRCTKKGRYWETLLRPWLTTKGEVQ